MHLNGCFSALDVTAAAATTTHEFTRGERARIPAHAESGSLYKVCVNKFASPAFIGVFSLGRLRRRRAVVVVNTAEEL